LLSSLDTDKPIPRLTYTEASDILARRGESRGASSRPLSRKEELALVEHFGGPVFVTHFPSTTKPFYMRRTEDGNKVRRITFSF